MSMRVHELHAAAVHAPLVLLPTAALLDLLASARRDRAYDRVARQLWLAGAGAGALAGVAGLAAAQEVRADETAARDTMWLHGIINFVIVAGATGIAAWRSRRSA